MSSTSGSRPATPLPEADLDLNGQHNSFEDNEDPLAPLVSDPTDNVDAEISDNDSILSDVDEAQFEDFDPANVAIEDRPAIAVDEDNVRLLGRYKRKRDGELDEAEGSKKKKKEGRREKPKKSRKNRTDEDEDDFSGGQELEGKRVRKRKSFTGGDVSGRREKLRGRKATPEDEETLTPEERRRRALDRAMDAALKNPSRQRRPRVGEVDLTAAIDEEVISLRHRMSEAAELDVEARNEKPPRPAMHKLRLLPEVTSLLNRNNRDVESAIVDPENNLLESVRFFLEPLSDGSLPAYNIQRELFAALAKLPVDKEALISSGIGKVVLFYTKSKKPELSIKRQAERLLGDWTRPILKRSDDYRKRVLASVEYDPTRFVNRNPAASASQSTTETAAQARARALALPVRNPNRARVDTEVKSYSIVPRSSQVSGGMFARPLGANGEDAFRKMKARQAVQLGKVPRR